MKTIIPVLLSLAFFVSCAAAPYRVPAGEPARGLSIVEERDGKFQIQWSGKPLAQLDFFGEKKFHFLDLSRRKPVKNLQEYVVRDISKDSRPRATLQQDGAGWTMATSALRVHVESAGSSTLRIQIQQGSSAPVEWEYALDKLQSRWRLAAGERIYGFGDKRESIDQRGNTVEILNHDAYASEDNDSYKSIPFYMSSRGYGVLFHNFYRSDYDIGHQSKDWISLKGTEGAMDFFVLAGPDLKELLAAYTDLTGKPAMLPRWFFGFHQSKASYKGREAMTVAQEMRARKLPLDVIYYDDWSDEITSKEFLGELWDKYKVRLTVGGNPFLMKDDDDAIYNEMAPAKQLWVDAKGQAFYEKSNEIDDWPAAYVDFFNPKAAEIFFTRKWAKALENRGPPSAVFGMADFGEMDHVEKPETKFFPSVNLSVAQARNIFALAYGVGMVHNARKVSGGRSTGMIRPGFAGSQRLGWTTTADSAATYKNWRFHMRALLNMTLSGFSNIGQDIGGWEKKGPDTLYARWFAAGTFFPFMWAHGQEDHEPYVHGASVEKVCREFLNLRYRLLPHFYSLHAEAHRSGIPMLRAPALQVPGDRRAATLDDEFFVGENMLVAPLLNDQGKRGVYLPQGFWHDFFAEKKIETGGREIKVAGTPLNRLPVFVRSGSFVALGPEMQYSGEKETDPLTIKYFAFQPQELNGGAREAEYSLYEDDGESNDYAKGAYQMTAVRAEQSATELKFKVSVRSGNGRYLRVPERAYVFEIHGWKAAGVVRVNVAKTADREFEVKVP